MISMGKKLYIQDSTWNAFKTRCQRRKIGQSAAIADLLMHYIVGTNLAPGAGLAASGIEKMTVKKFYVPGVVWYGFNRRCRLDGAVKARVLRALIERALN